MGKDPNCIRNRQCENQWPKVKMKFLSTFCASGRMREVEKDSTGKRGEKCSVKGDSSVTWYRDILGIKGMRSIRYVLSSWYSDRIEASPNTALGSPLVNQEEEEEEEEEPFR